MGCAKGNPRAPPQQRKKKSCPMQSKAIIVGFSFWFLFLFFPDLHLF
jgi:hypothetical protein